MAFSITSAKTLKAARPAFPDWRPSAAEGCVFCWLKFPRTEKKQQQQQQQQQQHQQQQQQQEEEEKEEEEETVGSISAKECACLLIYICIFIYIDNMYFL